MGSLLEEVRQAHEDVESIDKAVSRVLLDKAVHPAMGISAEFAAKDLAEEGRRIAGRALALYQDDDKSRKAELAFLAGAGGGPGGSSDVFANFFGKVKEIKEYYRKHGAGLKVPQSRDPKFWADKALENERSESLFSGEEGHGQFIDLQTAYVSWCNLKKYADAREKRFRDEVSARLQKKNPDMPPAEVDAKAKDEVFEQPDYLSWLNAFDRFHEIPRVCKWQDKEYRAFVDALLAYLEGAFQRHHVLGDFASLDRRSEEEFEDRWSSGQVPGWVLPTYKDPLFALPSQRLFASEGTLNSHKSGKAYKKKLQALQSLPLADQQRVVDQTVAEDKELARIECRIQKLREVFADTIDATVAHLQKKQSRTVEEMEQALEEQEEGEQSDIDEDEEPEEDIEKPIYNPLNLPLGFDGKPIPFWLYKLHGLGTEFKCEICGNYSYWGRRAFDRHFQEWRHAYGMRALKIPNTQHFKDVTKIEDAVRLYEKLRRDATVNTFNPEQDVECEDSQGHVMSLRAYTDLKRQGLV